MQSVHTNLCFGGFFLFADEMPFEFMAKASRMVKIDKEQISGIKLKSTVPLFLLYPVCLKYNTLFLNDDVELLWRPPETDCLHVLVGGVVCMSVLCHMSLSVRCGRVCSCRRAWCVLRNYIYT